MRERDWPSHYAPALSIAPLEGRGGGQRSGWYHCCLSIDMKKSSSLTKISKSLFFVLSVQCLAEIAHHLQALTSQPEWCGQHWLVCFLVFVMTVMTAFSLISVTSVPAAVNAKKKEEKKNHFLCTTIWNIEVWETSLLKVGHSSKWDCNHVKSILKLINHTLQLKSPDQQVSLQPTLCSCYPAQPVPAGGVRDQNSYSVSSVLSNTEPEEQCWDTVPCREHFRHQMAAQFTT